MGINKKNAHAGEQCQPVTCRQGSQRPALNALPTTLDDPFHTLLNEQQAADYLGWTKRTLQQRRYYSLPPVYIKLPGSKAVRYRLSELMAFVAAGEVPLPL